MFKKMMVVSAMGLMVFSLSGNVWAGEKGGPGLQQKTRTQSEKRLQPKGVKCDGPRTQARTRTRASY